MGLASSGERAAIPWRSSAFQTVLVSTFVLPLGVPLVSPLLPLVSQGFAVTDVRASFLISAYFLPGIVLSPLIGTVVDRAGRRPVLVSSLLLFGSVGLAIIGLDDFTAVIAARFVQGIGAAGVFITTVTIIADSFTGLQRNVVFGINVAVLSIGRVLYPLLGGALARYGWSVPFGCYLVAILASAVVYRGFHETGWIRRSAPSVTLRETIADLPAVQGLMLYGASIGSETFVFGAMLTSLPFILVADFGASTVVIGAVLAAATGASAVVAAGNGWLASWSTNQRLVASGFVLYGVSLVGMGRAPTLVTMAAVALLFGGGIGLILPSVDAALSELVGHDHRARALSLRNSATGLGRATGPFLFTAIATVTGYRFLLVAGGIVAFVVGVGGLVSTSR